MTHKLISSIIVLSFIIPCLPPVAVISEPFYPEAIKFEGNCDHGLHKQPNGPMAAIVFCEGALGTYLGLVYYEPMGAPVPIKYHNELIIEEKKQNYYKVWSLENRLWQDPLWSADVTSYAWGPNGNKIFIATSNVYGSGALYELDLVRKNYKQIGPKGKNHSLSDPGPGFLIINITSDYLVYKHSPYDLPEKINVNEMRYKINS